MQASWEDVILDKNMKKLIVDDVKNFFDGREAYERLRVPWKRGIIYYGPPGNGKTISIKAMMNSLYKRDEPVPTLYVKTLTGFGGPENSLKLIFSLARRTAPCLLVFEDLDSIVSEDVRSYFLNEVDGIRKNDGILIVSTIPLPHTHGSTALLTTDTPDRLNQPPRPTRPRHHQTSIAIRSKISLPEPGREGTSPIHEVLASQTLRQQGHHLPRQNLHGRGGHHQGLLLCVSAGSHDRQLTRHRQRRRRFLRARVPRVHGSAWQTDERVEL